MSRYTNKDVADWETRQEKRHYGELLSRPKQEGVGKPVSQFAVGRKEAKKLNAGMVQRIKKKLTMPGGIKQKFSDLGAKLSGQKVLN